MWNYSYVMPSLIVLAVFLGYYYALPRIPIRANLTFLKLVTAECLVMTSDIVSTWACMNYQDLPVEILYLLNELYFVAFYLRGYMFFIFTVNILRIGINNDGKFCILVQLPAIIMSLIAISSSRTGLVFYFDENGYHSGPLYNGLYVELWLYIIAAIVLVVYRRDRLMRQWDNSCIWYNVILLIGSIVRLMFPKYLLMDTFCLVSLIIIYLSFVNPDFYLETRSWIFNYRAFREYVEEINNKKTYRILGFVIHNYRDYRELYGVKQMDRGLFLLGDFIRRSFKDDMVFYYRSGRFIILGDEDMDFNHHMNIIRERFIKVNCYFEFYIATLNSTYVEISLTR